MARPRLHRRRLVLLPTLAGFVVYCAILGGTALTFLRGLGDFLAPSDPTGRGLLVVEGWLPAEGFRIATRTFESGAYDAVIVSGGPVEDPVCSGAFGTYAERGAAMLRQLGLAEPALIAVPAPASAQDRTYRSAVSVREWARRVGRTVTSLDVLSEGPHARRTRTMYRLAFGDGVEVGVLVAPPTGYSLSRWWEQAGGVREVFAEALAYGWTLCCFYPGPRGSHQELWAEPESS